MPTSQQLEVDRSTTSADSPEAQEFIRAARNAVRHLETKTLKQLTLVVSSIVKVESCRGRTAGYAPGNALPWRQARNLGTPGVNR